VVAGIGQWCSAVGASVEQGRQHHDCHVSTQWNNATKETPETAETHIEKRLKRLLVRIGETRAETAEVDQCWPVVAGIGQWCSAVGARVEPSRKAANAACSAVFDANTVR
jgi:hypothetical protein